MKDHVRRGRRARDRGKWAEAYAAYKAAFEAAHPASSTERERAELAGELGLCELALRKYRDAAEHLAFSLEQRTALPLALQLRFENGEREAIRHVATLLLSVDPSDAEVLVDGKRVGRVARTYKLFLEPGQRMVRAFAPGRQDGFHEFGAVAGTAYNVRMPLPRLAVSLAPESPPGSPKEASTTRSSSPVVRGRPPSPWTSWPGALRITGFGLTLATGSLGAVFMVRARTADGDLDERNAKLDAVGVSQGVCRDTPKPSACAELTSLQRERDLFAGLGTAMVVTSGVVGAATLASFFTDFSSLQAEPTKARVALVPTFAPTQAGLVAYGAW
ncbi:PEGA domain-containing protein [Sorangium sp. So ce1335]|uniref:PEGA domain-containing protein n=1 Tax=Sorangium sp. So ce1335 TaxID=3133335 RepID=UPI003F5DDE43